MKIIMSKSQWKDIGIKNNWFKTSAKGVKKQKLGDCFVAAGRYIMEHLSEEGLVLVHGIATGRGPIAGIQFAHAWLEKGETVIDVSNNRHIEMPKAVYYALGNISTTFKYTWEEANKKMLETKKWGPWEFETEY